MITGFVNGYGEATIPLVVQHPEGERLAVSAVLDTGFNGFLTLPVSVIDRAGGAWLSRGRAILANGEEAICDVYSLVIEWDGQARAIEVDSAETTPLVGMSLCYGYKLRVDVVNNGIVVIRRIDG